MQINEKDIYLTLYFAKIRHFFLTFISKVIFLDNILKTKNFLRNLLKWLKNPVRKTLSFADGSQPFHDIVAGAEIVQIRVAAFGVQFQSLVGGSGCFKHLFTLFDGNRSVFFPMQDKNGRV